MKDLRERVIRGASARICAQAASFLLRIGSLMVLARLLDPTDFGLVGMVTAVTGVLDLFRDFGLSAASVQRAAVTEEQISTLFWVNCFRTCTGCRRFLSRASAVLGHERCRNRIRAQWSGRPTRGNSAAANAFYCFGNNRRFLPDDRHLHRHWNGGGWLRILGSRYKYCEPATD
jgi:Polysaccharide biosynthesis protein